VPLASIVPCAAPPHPWRGRAARPPPSGRGPGGNRCGTKPLTSAGSCW